MTGSVLPGPVEVAAAAWGADLPDWVAKLAQESAKSSQNAVGKRLGRSGSMISQILSRKYKASLSNIEELVRGVLMNGSYDCPARGEIPMQECQSWREKARNFSPGSTQRVQMYRACTRCPRFLNEGSE